MSASCLLGLGEKGKVPEVEYTDDPPTGHQCASEQFHNRVVEVTTEGCEWVCENGGLGGGSGGDVETGFEGGGVVEGRNGEM
jgi:hypothetical protein